MNTSAQTTVGVWIVRHTILVWFGIFLNALFIIPLLFFPRWMLDHKDLMDSALTAVKSQVKKGMGYPVCLAEALQTVPTSTSPQTLRMCRSPSKSVVPFASCRGMPAAKAGLRKTAAGTRPLEAARSQELARTMNGRGAER